MKAKLTLMMLVLALLFACKSKEPKTDEAALKAEQELLTKAQQFFKVLPAIAENPENLPNEAKIKLGKQLYFDVNLSKGKTQSCNTCHNLSTFGVDNNQFSKGDEGKNGARNSPTVLNAAFKAAQFWDGRMKDVEEQAGGPILNPVEMAIPDEAFLVKRLQAIPAYVEMFKQAFPESKDPITYTNIRLAIAAFERTLITPSKFDEYLGGKTEALNADEKRGMTLFMDNNCTMCHTGELLGGQLYMKFGLTGNYWDLTKSNPVDEGKFTVTKQEADKYVFLTPGLRNVEKTGPYFHDGSVSDLAESVKMMAKLELGKDLTDVQAKDIVTFLNTLTGKLAGDQYVAPEPIK